MDWRLLQQNVRDEVTPDAGSGGARPNRRVRQLAVAAGLVAVVAVGAGAWYFSSQAPSTSRDASRPSLASNALQTARDVGSFLRENVTRDIGNVAALLRRPGADEAVEEPEDADGLSEADADAAPSVPRTVRRRKEPTAPPEFQTGVEALPWAEVPLE